MRTLMSAGALVAAAALSLLAAPSALATPPGDNGTVKIHDATTGEELRKNEPHVCTFYLDAFGFDGRQQVDWHIEAWAPTADVKGETVKSGSLTLDGEGHGRTDGPGACPTGTTSCSGTSTVSTAARSTRSSGPTARTTPSRRDRAASPVDKPRRAAERAAVHRRAEPAPADDQSTSPADTSPPSAPARRGDLAETGNGAPVGVAGRRRGRAGGGRRLPAARRRTAASTEHNARVPLPEFRTSGYAWAPSCVVTSASARSARVAQARRHAVDRQQQGAGQQRVGLLAALGRRRAGACSRVTWR